MASVKWRMSSRLVAQIQARELLPHHLDTTVRFQRFSGDLLANTDSWYHVQTAILYNTGGWNGNRMNTV